MIMLICNQSLSGCKCFFSDETAFGTNEHTSNLPPLFPFFYFYYISKYSKKMRDMWDKISLLSVTSSPLLSPVQFIYTILTWQRKLNRTTRVTWVLCSICTAHVFWPHIAAAKCMIIKLIEPVTLRPINRWMRGRALDALESTVAVCFFSPSFTGRCPAHRWMSPSELQRICFYKASFLARGILFASAFSKVDYINIPLSRSSTLKSSQLVPIWCYTRCSIPTLHFK